MVATDINEKWRYRTVFRWLSDNVELIRQLKLQSRSNSLPKCVWTHSSYTAQCNPFVLQVGNEALWDEWNNVIWCTPYGARFLSNVLWLIAAIWNVVSVSLWGYRYGDWHVSSRRIIWTGSNSSKPRNTLLTRFEAFTYGLKNPTDVVYSSTWLFDQSGILMNALAC